jgi:hypothetical protein
MDVFTQKTTRRATRLRAEISVTVTSMDRRHPFSAKCIALVVGPQGCGLRAPQSLPLETPVLLSELPGGRSASARVANCQPLGQDGKDFLIGIALYNPGNVWGIANPPEDWNCADVGPALAGATAKSAVKSQAWPYNMFSGKGEAHPGRK